MNPDVVYFFLVEQRHHLGVDLRARKVVDYEACVSSHNLPWVLPPAISAVLSRHGGANGANGVAPASLASSQPSGSNGA
uniref:Uncharacterized protein n=1 Tax=Oryza brachyantha TaxID=4533 RepID=J3KY50_ORYBR